MNKATLTADVLVIGAGLAGCRAAIAAAEEGADTILVSQPGAASAEIMGLNAPAAPGDNTDCYAEDMLQSGCGLSSEKHARLMAAESIEAVRFLEKIGLEMDRSPDGSFHQLHALGCRYPRVIHNGAQTGRLAMGLMRKQAIERGVRLIQGEATALAVGSDGWVCGAEVNDQLIRAGSVLLASGGMSALQPFTTYPRHIFGAMMVLAMQAGAELMDAEFQQFEPCAFVYPKKIRGIILPTTLLRVGGVLRTAHGDDVLKICGLRVEGLQKDVLSRAMKEQIERDGTEHHGLWFDLRNVDEQTLKRNHSIFYKPAFAAGVDLCKTPAEVAPAAHTHLGGLRVDENGWTYVPGLFAAGEICGGIHGANRLGGGSGAETMVFGARAGRSAALAARNIDGRVRLIRRKKTSSVESALIGSVLAQSAGMIRNQESMEKGLERLKELDSEQAILARAQLMASLRRRENLGVFARSDAEAPGETLTRTVLRYDGRRLIAQEEKIR